MALRYYPLSRIMQNLYTRGDEYQTEDGNAYSGKYYKTYDGKVYTGINPVLGDNRLLIPITRDKVEHGGGREQTLSTETYANLPQNINQFTLNPETEAGVLTELAPYYPTPLESDYARGYFTRYFAKTVSGPGYVFEISNADWTKLQNREFNNNILGYESINMLWQLTGPLNDRRVSQYQVQGGVSDTNKRVTENTNKRFRGLLEFIGGDYTKFARITP